MHTEVVRCTICMSQVELTWHCGMRAASPLRLPQQHARARGALRRDGEEDVRLQSMRHERTEVPAHHAVPVLAKLLVECLLDVLTC